MGKGLLFFCCSCCILVLTIINLSIGPIITGRTDIEGTMNCAEKNDLHDKAKDLGASDDDLKYTTKWAKDECLRKKGMHDMEYTAFIFDIVIGFVCGLIGLLHLFDLKKDFVVKTGLIGLGCGVVGFVLTFVYVIFNGLVYTQYYDNEYIIKRDGDGIFAELKGDNYKCKYFDEEGNTHALIAKYSDLGEKQYNYNKDLSKSYEAVEVSSCRVSNDNTIKNIICKKESYTPLINEYRYGDNNEKCKNLYVDVSFRSLGIENKDTSDRFLTALILSLIVCLANIGLALFGFLLFRAPSDF